MKRPRPADDPDTAGFFEAARRGELVVCVCQSCNAVLHLPRGFCHHCGGSQVGWKQVSGEARLYSWTTVVRPVLPSFPVPYTVVLVELDDAPGVRLIGHLPGEPELTPGMPMRVHFEERDGVVLPNFKPVQPAHT